MEKTFRPYNPKHNFLLPRSLAQSAGDGNYYRWPDSAAYDRLWARGASLFRLTDLYRVLSGFYDSFAASEIRLHRR